MTDDDQRKPVRGTLQRAACVTRGRLSTGTIPARLEPICG